MIDKESLINELEAAWEDEEKALALKTQMKVITDSIKDRLADFATESEISKKLMNEAYSRFKKLKQKKLNASDEDYYTLMEAVDEYFIEDEEEDTEKE